QNVGPTLFRVRGDALAQLPVVDLIEQNQRRGHVEIPDVVAARLKVPAVLPRLRLERHDGGTEEIVAPSPGTVVRSPRIAGIDIDEPQVRVQRGLRPNRRAARFPGVTLPGVVSDLTRSWHRIEAPDFPSALGIVRGHATPKRSVTSRQPDEDHPVVVE